jgi:hypothetical protein
MRAILSFVPSACCARILSVTFPFLNLSPLHPPSLPPRLYDIKYFDHDTRRRPQEIYSWTPDFKRVAQAESPEPAKLMGR